MNVTSVCLIQILFPLLLVMTYCLNFMETREDTEYVKVSKVSGEIRRRRRSLRVDFPSRLIFQFEMKAGNITLNLLRSVHPNKVTPIYSIEHENVIKQKDAIQEAFGVYQDQSLGASVIVKSPFSSMRHCEIFGSFTHENQHYQIEPLVPLYRKRRSDNELTSEEVHSGSVQHRVRRFTDPLGDFSGDELLPPPDSSGLNRGIEIPPYPGAANKAKDSSVPMFQLQMTKAIDRIFETTTEHYESDILLPHTYSSRDRRQADETLYIEYMVVIDYKNLERWKAKVGGSTEEERVDNAFGAMHEYYQFVVNGIDVRFRTATADGPEIRVEFVTLLVSTEEKTSPWIQNNKLSPDTIDDAGVLLDFATWRNSVIQYLPSHDHAGLYTGFDIATPTSLNPIGMGYLNSICHNSWAVSEVEETYNAIAIHIAAHELGHNIGTRHDGNGNGCPSSSLYLMAPRLPFIYNEKIRSNPWKFSTCSQKAIKTYLDGLGSNNCLTNTPAQSSLNEEMPGLKYSADEQCNMTYGNDAVLCRDNLYYQWDSICYATQCKKKGDNSCTGRFFPFDGTPCGDKKWCKSGECVFSEDAPSYNEACLFGDDPNVDCTLPNVCDESNMYSSKVRCCGTCSQTTSSSTSSSSTSVMTSAVTSTKLSTTLTVPSTTSSTIPPSTTSRTTPPPSTSSTTPQSSRMSSSTSSPTTSSSTASSETTPTSSSTSSITIPNSTPSTISSTMMSNSPSQSTNSSTTSSSTTTTTKTTTSSGAPLSTTSAPTVSTFTTPSTASSTSESSSETSSLPTTVPTTEGPQSELSFDLQTMISLFISSALVI